MEPIGWDVACFLDSPQQHGTDTGVFMASGEIWHSRIMHDSTLMKSATNDAIENDIAFAAETTRRNKAGEPLTEEQFPKEMRPMRMGERYGDLPNIFCAGGYWVVSRHFADVMQRCELGQTSFYPVSFFQSDMKTRVDGEFFHLNFAETKEAFDPVKSKNVTSFSSNVWRAANVPKDGEIAVSDAALSGADLWVDPRLRHSVFMSKCLVEHLRKEKLTQRLGLAKCTIVQSNES